MVPPALEFRNVSKTYRASAGQPIHAVDDVSFTIFAGQIIAIVGRSGSGKSTLLHLAAGIDLPTAGQIALDGQEIGRVSERERTRLRRDRVGLVFQFFHLLSHLSVSDNVRLPAMIAGDSGTNTDTRVHELLDRVGLADRQNDGVEKLSGGEMQRVAICRALVRKPRLLLADEPTGNLDDETGSTVMDLMLGMVREEGGTLIFVTHSTEMAARADTVWTLHSGRLEHE
jgi:ABC-type lipoprotein export system ATPase subunit